jgi:hypothetical protein
MTFTLAKHEHISCKSNALGCGTWWGDVSNLRHLMHKRGILHMQKGWWEAWGFVSMHY